MKIICFYLPQFHRIPENDVWWGEGFTEWTNTKKAKPLYEGHRQPRIPFNNNYYNLLDEKVRIWQAELAKEYGIGGFCYYHYWFKGKQLLEKPFNAVLKNKKPDFPFCLCWANEPWTRSWDGKTGEILMPQDYGDKEDWKQHFNYLLNAFLDERYIKIDDKPIFIIYRSSSIEKCSQMMDYWNDLAVSNGLKGIYFISMLTSFDNYIIDDFDAHLEFEPMYTIKHDMPLYLQAKRFIKKKLIQKFNKGKIDKNSLDIINYDLIWQRIIGRESKYKKKTFLGAFVDWDNSARKGTRALIVEGSTPGKFKYYLDRQVQRSLRMGNELLFINAWNEWAEGTYLEPDTDYGYEYLEAVREVLQKNQLN